MSEPTDRRRERRVGWVVVSVLTAVVLAISGVAIAMAGPSSAAPDQQNAAAPASAGKPAGAVDASTTSGASAQHKAVKAAEPARPKPQPTKAAALHASTPVVIAPAFTVKVTDMQPVQGQGQGPGEIGGPSVRFTIAIANTTGKRVDLTHTVVNAYYGADATPAVQLGRPGARAFPASVADGGTVTGAFVFNIPAADRGAVRVTVDTSVLNPVVAFEGAAPR